MNKKFLFVVMCFFLCFNLKAQSLREKIYLHTDKNEYILGDTIWFKSYLVDALTQTPSPKSGIEYVELINENKQVIKRLALHTTLGTSFGDMVLDTSYETGSYFLRGYTNWMQNFGDSLFFQKEITISGIKNNWLSTTSKPRLTDSGSNVAVRQVFQFTDAQQVPVRYREVSFYVTDAKGKVLQQGTLQTDKEGKVETGFALTKEQAAAPVFIEVGNSRKDIKAKIPLFADKNIDIQFLPESGHLVAGLPNKVGFKALDASGSGCAVAGTIKDKEGNDITAFASVYKGMGILSFTPAAGNTYTAFLNNGQQILLPPAEASGTLIDVRQQNANPNIGFTIAATKDRQNQGYTLLARVRGKIIYQAKANLEQGFINGSIAKTAFPSGIASFILENEKGQIVNERAFFVNNHDALNIAITTPQPGWHAREKIPVSIKVKDSKGKPVIGSFSIAVTDDSQVKKDTAQDENILSYLLLQSDLSGTIETPGYYFSNHSDTAQQALDALMLTQGFVQYDWDTTKFKYKAEQAFEIKGKLTNGLKKAVADGNIMLFTTGKTTIIQTTKTDGSGHFIFKDFPAFDTAIFVVKAANRKGSHFGLGIDLQKFVPAPVIELPKPLYNSLAIDSNLLNTLKSKIVYRHALEKLYGHVLEDVKVTTRKKIAGSHNLNGAEADQVIGPETIREQLDKNLFQLIQDNVKGFRLNHNIVGVATEDGKNIYRIDHYGIGPNTSVGCIIDGQALDEKYFPKGSIADYEDPDKIASQFRAYLEQYPASDIKSIEVITSDSLLNNYYKRADVRSVNMIRRGIFPKTNILEITTYSGRGPNIHAEPGMEYMRPIPFFYGRTFYSPKYNAPQKMNAIPDLRSTIYWNPTVVTNEKGEAQIDFYSADNSAHYTIWMEGMDLKGEIGTTVKEIAND